MRSLIGPLIGSKDTSFVIPAAEMRPAFSSQRRLIPAGARPL